MNPYRYQVVCEVCGEPGLGHVKDAGLDWLGVAFTHEDPMVCAANLRWRKQREKREQESAQTMLAGAGI